MAMTIRGMSLTRTFTASRFPYYTAFLTTINREEIIATATLYKHEKSDSDGLSSEDMRGQSQPSRDQ